VGRSVINNHYTDVMYSAWLGGITVGCRTYDRDVDRDVVDSTSGRVAVRWLLLGWVTVCGQVNMCV